MGELSLGRSATCPTFFRSTSVRTRIDLQYSHTVCTLLDQRNTIGAAQFGQFEVRSVIVLKDLLVAFQVGSLRTGLKMDHLYGASTGAPDAGCSPGARPPLPRDSYRS